MPTIKGITIDIAGKTSSLVSDLQKADKALNDTNSALKAVDKALKLDPTNVELLAQKEALLTKAVGETKDRLDTLKEAAELAAKGLEEGTTTQEQYAQLTAEIAMTEAELKNLEDGGREAGKAAEESGVNWEKFGTTAAAAAKVAAAAIGAVTAAATAAGKALIDCALDGGKFADEFLTLSVTTGVSAQTLQEWSYAAEIIDVDLGTMSASLTKTTKAIASAAEGNAGAIENFENLGVSFQNADGSMRDSEDVFLDIIDALGKVENETERDALAMELLGKSAKDLNPLIESGSERLTELGEEAQEVGYVLDDETLDSFRNLDDQMQKLSLGGTAAKNAIGTILLPVLTSLAGEGVDLLGEFTNAVLDADGDVTKISDIVAQMLPQIIDVIMSYLPMLLELAGTLIEAVAQGLIDNLDVILPAALDVILTICDGILGALPELVPVLLEVVMTIVNYILDNLDLIINTAIQIIVAVVNGISSALPRLIPVVVQAVVTIVNCLIDNLPLLIESGLTLTGAIITGLLQAIPELILGAGSIVENLVTTIAEAGPSLIDTALNWGADLIDSFVSGISNAIPNLISELSSVGDTIASYLHFTSPDVGPLANDLIGKSGKDMIVTFADGMEDELGTLESALTVTGNTIAGGMTGADTYGGVLSSINEGIGAIGSRTPHFTIMIGNEELQNYIITANDNYNYSSGGF